MNTPTPAAIVVLMDQISAPLSRAIALANLLECCYASPIAPKFGMLEIVAGLLVDELTSIRKAVNDHLGKS
ncbi:MAG: hypothetical protein HQL99_16630 [Magnetococcales bacterium]|nr:hypothetical protein [Magnetococcales bacterium]